MKRLVPALVFVVCVVLVWEFIVRGFSIPEYLLPAPSVVLHRLLSIRIGLLAHVGYTALESALGFLLGTAFGIMLAVIFTRSRTLELGIYPYAIALKTVPIVAIAPLLVVWFGNGILPKVIVAAIISFFPVVVNTTKGLRNVDAEAFDLFDSMSATPSQVFFKLRVPSALPYLFAALRISSTLAVIGAIVGEFSGADRGLGFFITISSQRLETVDMFVGILMSSLLGIGFFYAIALLEKIVVPWEPHIDIDVT
jgi:NitT/TauT family transport system permease protein